MLGRKEKVALASRQSLAMQKAYGWDFGARGVALNVIGEAGGPLLLTELAELPAVMAPRTGPNARYYVPTLVESLLAQPTAALPDPEDGQPRPDSAPFRKLVDVIVPIVTPEMRQAYAAGEALGRMSQGRAGVAVLADMPGHQAVAFAAGAATAFEPVLLLDNWPHPHGVVPSHLALAALAYYQPRFAAQSDRVGAPPLFVLDRLRLNAYSEEGDRFDNRYYARVPPLESLAQDGVRTLLYVVATPAALPEPDDLNPLLAPASGAAGVEVRAMALTDFRRDPAGRSPEEVHYGGSPAGGHTFWLGHGGGAVGSSATSDHRFLPRAVGGRRPVSQVPVMVTEGGLIVAAALDRRGSMNRFAGGWSG
jgi:hypothetical protein